jgi:hypothetical protein
MQAVIIMTGSSSSTRDCKIGNNITHGRPWSFHQNNLLHVLDQKLHYREQYQTWQSNIFQSEQWVQSFPVRTMGPISFPVRTMGSSCSSRDCNMGNNIKMANHALFAEQLDPHAQPGTAIRGTVPLTSACSTCQREKV